MNFGAKLRPVKGDPLSVAARGRGKEIVADHRTFQ
jgi:hypothetical protein